MPERRVPRRKIDWKKASRIISSRFRPVEVYRRISNEEDYDALEELEQLTQPQAEKSTQVLAQKTPRPYRGPQDFVISRPFNSPNPSGSRFSDGSYGVLYLARELKTAIAETVYHRERFLAATEEPPVKLEMRIYWIAARGVIHDLRKLNKDYPRVYSKTSYSASQKLGKKIYELDSNGIAYSSVRKDGGNCLALFTPDLVYDVTPGACLCYPWNGEKIEEPYEIRELKKS